MRALISWSTVERNFIPQNGHSAIAPEASVSMMVCGRFYLLRVERPSGYDRPLSMNGAENWDRVHPAKSIWRIAYPLFAVQKIAQFSSSSRIKWLC
jgi:hypothetical protein